MYAILDIETTGGKYNEEGITEIAIHKFDGHSVVDSFISLVNPEREIQEFVVKLTGINSNMLRNAPKFYQVAKRIITITENCTLVAHNASFDYRILRTEFNRLGYNFERNTICTVELSKKLITNAPSYSLGKLSKSLGIAITDRHRANGDALATVKLFKLLLEKDINKEILKQTTTYFDSRTTIEKLNKLLEKVPKQTGVFYLHNAQKKVIFIGRGNNIKKEVNTLFLKKSERATKIQEKTVNISFEKTGNALITKLKYYEELSAIKPKYNIRKKIKTSANTNFNHTNFIIINKGRTIEENGIVLIENEQVIGYGFTNLAHQEIHINILKSIITPIINKQIAKTIVKNYLKATTTSKIIRL